MAVVATGMITLTDLNDAKQMNLFIALSGVPTQQQTFDPNSGVYSPNFPTTKPVLTPNLIISGSSSNIITSSDVKSIKWFVDGVELTVSNADYTIAGSGIKTLTVNTNVLASVNSRRYEVEVVYTDPDTKLDTTMRAPIELYKITGGVKGANAVVAYLTNESHLLPSNSAGTVLSFTGATSTLKIYEGGVDVTSSWAVTRNNGGATVTEATSGAAAVTATVTAVPASPDTTTITWTATRSGYTTLTKNFTLTKVRGGESAKTYDIVADGAIKRKEGVYASPSILVKAREQIGSANPTDYSGRFIITEQDAAGVWSTAKYTSSGNESSRSYTPSSSTIKAIKVVLCQAGGTTVVLDEQTIPVIEDGSEPVINFVSAQNGNVVTEGNPITIQSDVYKGINLVTPTYTWYVQESAQTVDQGAGVGWRILNHMGTAPTVAASSSVGASGGTLTAGTYYIKYTWLTATGETVAGPEKTQAVTAGQTLIVTPPAFPAGVYGANIYVGKVTGTYKLQGKVSTSGGNLTMTKPVFENTVAPPTAYTGVTGTSTMNEKVLTVPASAVNGLETFRCIATYDGSTYSGAVTVTDVSDPVQVEIFGVRTFKNGQGTVTLEAIVKKNGLTVNDIDETLYTYKWSIYNDANVQNMAFGTAGFKTGRSITVAADDIDVRGSVYVEVEDK